MLLCHVIKPIITEHVKSMQLKKCTYIFFLKYPTPLHLGIAWSLAIAYGARTLLNLARIYRP